MSIGGSGADSDSESDLVGVPLKKRVLKHQDYYLSRLPESGDYCKSIKGLEYTVLAAQPSGSLVIVGSHAGHVDIRQHRLSELELVRRLEGAHKSSIRAIAFSQDGKSAASLSAERICVYDVETADQTLVLELGARASTLTWLGSHMLAVAIAQEVRVYNIDGEEQFQVTIHKRPVLGIAFAPQLGIAISWDSSLIEYWGPQNGHMPHVTGLFSLRSETDLFYFRKQKRGIRSVSIAPNGKRFVVLDTEGSLVLFDTLSGKRVKEIDETLSTLCDMQRLGSGTVLDDKDFKTRVDTESKNGDTAVFDASSEFVIYPTLVGIKVLALKTSSTVKVYGKEDNVRFHELALLMGSNKQISLDAAGSKNDLIESSMKGDPALLALSKGDLYVFGNQPTEQRDAYFGQHKEPQGLAPQEPSLDLRFTKTTAPLHTTLGDIEIELERALPPAKGAFEIKEGAISVGGEPRQGSTETPKYSVGITASGLFITTETTTYDTAGKVVRGEDIVDAIASSKTRVDLL